MNTAPPVLTVQRRPERFVSDDRRVIPRLFLPNVERARRIVCRVLALPESRVAELDAQVRTDFASRHHDIDAVLLEHFAEVIPDPTPLGPLSPERQRLIGAYFTMEYAIESAALFNPSIVPHPDQSATPAGTTRFLMSLRATGEGHISSIVFRSGTIDRTCHLTFDPAATRSARVRVNHGQLHERALLEQALREMGQWSSDAADILRRLPQRFELDVLEHTVDGLTLERAVCDDLRRTIDQVLWWARSNYELHYPPGADPNAAVVFPTSANECNGIEDLRLVHFTDEDGTQRYFGTYTAYDGSRIHPQLLETVDFSTIRMHTLSGRFARNKGMALFPRRIDGAYAMVARLDGENLFLMRSNSLVCWTTASIIQEPTEPWEFVQLGNCGSPLETADGWLVVTHGVGPMRRYCIGATLLDRDHPERVIGTLTEPLIVPTEEERNGYVPNVVYSCGAMVHGDHLVIPYAMSDSATSFATVRVADVLAHLH